MTAGILTRRITTPSSWMTNNCRSLFGLRNGDSRNYSLAIARRVPRSFPDALTMPGDSNSNSNSRIDYGRATAEHDRYLTVLRKHVPVVCLPALDDLPDSVFVEDTVVAIGNRAVLTNPGHHSRRPEVESIGYFLENQLGMEVTYMRDAGNGSAICDGGDVMFTGRHLFVGISGDRTNRDALGVLEEGLGVAAIPIPFDQRKGALHLKSITTHLDDRTLVVPDTDFGRSVFAIIADASGGAYSEGDALFLPEHAGLSCNLVSLPSRGAVMAQLVHEGDARTRSLLLDAASERGFSIDFVQQAEAAKCDGALTCCSVLLDI